MPPPRPAPSANSTSPARSSWAWIAALGVLALLVFAWKLGDEPFVDEYAYISQAYYADLYIEGRWSEPAWLDLPAYDLVPLPKYLIGLAERATGEPRLGPAAARAWYHNIESRFGTPRLLTVSRLPMIALGAMGCVALAALGTLAFNLRTGILAGLLLMLNPLYSVHAHRAMSEAPCEAFLLTALALALAAWRRGFGPNGRWPSTLVVMGLAGMATGLSIASKFNGLLALMTMGAWAVAAWAIPRGGRFSGLGFSVGAGLAGTVTAVVFIVLNPFMTVGTSAATNPEARKIAEKGLVGRFLMLVDHRRTMSAGQQESFPHDALTSLRSRAKVVAIQGFGRFGPLGPEKPDSRTRYDWKQDWGAVAWLPTCLAGLGFALAFGRAQFRRREPPTAWAVVVWALVSLFVVTAYLPMAWDRYQLPIQAPFALLAASGLVAVADAFAWYLGIKPRVEPS